MGDLDNIISLIRSCLLSSKGGITVENLSRDYESLEGEKIPFRRLGFSSLNELLHTIPGLKSYRRGDSTYIETIPTPETAHIASMVAKQKSKTKRNRKSMFRDGTRHRRPNISASPYLKISQPTTRNPFNFSNQRTNLKPLKSPTWQPNQQPPPLRRQQSSTPSPTNVSLLRGTEPLRNLTTASVNRTAKNLNPTPVNYPPPLLDRAPNERYISHVSSPLSQPSQPPQQQQQQQQQQQPRSSLSERLVRPLPIPTLVTTFNVRENTTVDRRVTFATHEKKNILPKAPPMVAPLPLISNTELSPSSSFTSPQLKDPRDELMHLVKLLKLPNPEYKIFQQSQQTKINAKLCSVTVGSKKYSSYPAEAKTEDEAQKLAAVQAVLDIHKNHGPLVQLQVTSDVETIKQRIIAIVDVHNGVLIEQLPIYYKETHNEILPNNWLRIVEECPKDLTLEKNGINNSYILWRYNEAIPKKETTPSLLDNILSSIGDAVPATLTFPTENLWPIYVQNVVNSAEIWVVINEENYNNRLVAMTAEMSKPNLEPKMPTKSVEVGRFYVIKEEEGWFRVRVDSVHSAINKADIFFIDTGDYETVSFEQLYPLDKRFCDVPAQAIKLALASLEEFSDCDKVSSLAENLLLYQHFYVSVNNREDSDNDYISVTFYDTSGDDDIHVNDLILEKFLSTNESLGFAVEGRVTEVFISNIELSGDIYVQTKPEGLKIIAILISRLISPSMNVESFKKAIVGVNPDRTETYIVKCPDGNWLRSRILDTPSNQKSKMLLIDFGGTVIVDNTQLLRLKPLSPELERYPHQAHKVQLYNIEKSNFNEQMMNRLLELAPRNERLLCKVIKSTNVPIVELFKRSQPDNVLISINNTLALIPEIDRNIEDGNNNVKTKKRLEKSIARTNSNDNDDGLKSLRRPPVPPVGDLFDVHVTNLAATPSNFIVQPYADIAALAQMMMELQTSCSAYNGPPFSGESLREGKLCAAKYNDGWYRAFINGIIDSQTVVVYLCDYGDMTPISTDLLRPLKKQFTELPYQAIKARLYGIEPLNVDWTPLTCKMFQNLVANKDFASIVRDIEKDDTSPTESIVSLELIDVSTPVDIKIHEKLVNEKRAILIVN